jgi:hypothetical protein
LPSGVHNFKDPFCMIGYTRKQSSETFIFNKIHLSNDGSLLSIHYALCLIPRCNSDTNVYSQCSKVDRVFFSLEAYASWIYGN